jgi:hypothetical protein
VTARRAGTHGGYTDPDTERSAGWSFGRPVDYSGPGTYRRPPDRYLRLQWLGPLLTRAGLSPPDVVVLEVPGRRSGMLRRATLVRTAVAGEQYLVALAGESEWVRNVRGAGGRVTIGRRQRRAVRLVEVPEAERPGVIRAYVLRWGRRPGSRAVAREARFFFGVDPDLPDDQLRAVAHRHPVFRVLPTGSLIDSFLPRPDLDVVHTRLLSVPPEAAHRAVLEMDFYRVPLIRLLIQMRGLPQRWAAARAGAGAPAGLEERRSFRIPDLASAGWLVLAQRPDEELVLGQVARPWAPAGTTAASVAGPDEFAAFDERGFARIALSIRVDPYGSEACLVTVETRVVCTDDASRRRFRRYWRLVGPFSALIRRGALRYLARELATERSAAPDRSPGVRLGGAARRVGDIVP